MPRRWLLALPAMTAAAAALGALVEAPLGALIAAGAAVGALVGLVVAALVRRRVTRLAGRVERVAGGDVESPPLLGDAPEWRALGRSLEAVGTSMRTRLDEVASERARVVRLLETLPSPILLFDAEELAFANAAARRLLALPVDPLQGPRAPDDVLAADDLAKAVHRAGDTGEEVEVEVERQGRTLQGRAAPTSEGEVALALTDLTEIRRLDAVRRDFVANASHELKTPVAGLQALSESLALAMDRDPDRARRMIERMQTEAERLAAMTRDLLDLARLEEVAPERSRQRVDLADVVRGQLERVAALAREREVQVHQALLVGAMVDAVPEDLRLIAGNLLENAVRYNRPDGWVSVTLRRATGNLVLDIADSGIGIPEHEQDRVFERFYRVDKGRSRAQGGTGLGLSLVRNAVQRLGGELALRSTPGEGSEFTVSLPAAPRD